MHMAIISLISGILSALFFSTATQAMEGQLVPFTYYCKLTASNSALEAGKSFLLRVRNSSVVVLSDEFDDVCFGEASQIGQQMTFEVGGDICAADGYDLTISTALFHGETSDAIAIVGDAENGLDQYLCKQAHIL